MTPQKKTTQNPGAQVDIHERTSTVPTPAVQGAAAQDIDLFLRQGMQTVQEVNRSLQRVQDEIAYLVNARQSMTPPTAFAQQAPLQPVGQPVTTPWSTAAGLPANASSLSQNIYGAPPSPAVANPWQGAQHQNPYQSVYQNPYQSTYQNPFVNPYAAQPAQQPIQQVPNAFAPGAPSPYALAGTSYAPNVATSYASGLPPIGQPTGASGLPGIGNAGAENIVQSFRPGAWQQTQQAFGQGRQFGSEFQAGSSRPFRLARDLRNAVPLRREPSMDLVDEGEVFLVRLEIPGVTKEDLDVTCFDDCVAVSAISGAGIEGDEGTLLRNERGSIEYRRVIDLPSAIQTDSCEANLKDGILTLRLGKQTPSAAPRHLDVMYG